jgi:hypothetical protein
MCKISEGGQVIQFQAVELQQRVEKLVCWNTKSLLIEHRACHDVPPCLNGGCGILKHAVSHKIHRRHIPLTHKVLQVLLRDLQCSSTQLCHGSEGKERQHPVSQQLPLFLDLFLYLSFFNRVGKEVGRQWEIMREDVGCVQG